MGIETVVIGTLQFLASLVRSIIDGWHGRRRSASGRLQHILAVKKEVNERLWKVLSETNGDAIIRELRRKDTYPELDESLRSVSPWFKVELKGTYHAGIEVFTSVQNVTIRNGIARRADPTDPTAETVYIVGRIPYEAIEGIDWEGDEYYGFTHIYCRFRVGSRRGPYAEVILYDIEAHELGNGHKFYERLEGVTWKPKRRGLARRWLDRREMRGMERG
jgi:hypothetical protein